MVLRNERLSVTSYLSLYSNPKSFMRINIVETRHVASLRDLSVHKSNMIAIADNKPLKVTVSSERLSKPAITNYHMPLAAAARSAITNYQLPIHSHYSCSSCSPDGNVGTS